MTWMSAEDMAESSRAGTLAEKTRGQRENVPVRELGVSVIILSQFRGKLNLVEGADGRSERGRISEFEGHGSGRGEAAGRFSTRGAIGR